MDAINSAAAFLLIRMKLKLSEQEMVQALLILFGISEKNHLMHSLLERMSKINKLKDTFDYLRSSGKIATLTPNDIYLIFSHAHIHHFSSTLNTTNQNVTRAMCELIPFLIRRYSSNHLPHQNEFG